MSEVPKPWSAENHAKNLEEALVLKDTRSFLYAQILSIDDRLKVINTEILEHILGKTSEPPTNFDYGRTETALDLQPPKFSGKGIIRGFRRKPLTS